MIVMFVLAVVLTLAVIFVFAWRIELPRLAEEDRRLSRRSQELDKIEKLQGEIEILSQQTGKYDGDRILALNTEIQRLLGPPRLPGSRYDYSKKWMPF